MTTDGMAVSPDPPGVLPGGSSFADTDVEMKLPARPEFLGLIRLASTEFAARMGFDPDVTEEFTMAINEACTAAVLAQGRRMLVSFRAAERCLEGEIIHVPGRESRDWKNGPEALYSALVLYSLADVVQSDTREGPVVTHIFKGRTRVEIG